MEEERERRNLRNSSQLVSAGEQRDAELPLLMAASASDSDDDAPIEEQVTAWLARLFPLVAQGVPSPASALAPWICDVLLSEHSVAGYGRDLAHFLRHMHEHGVEPLAATADHVRLYKAALLKAGMRPATIARRLSVLRGVHRQFAIKGLIDWEVAQDIAAVKAPPVAKNSTPALTSQQAVDLLETIPRGTLQGIRDLALLHTFFITGCRVSAITRACVGHLEHDGEEHYLHVTEKRNKRARKILLHAARSVLDYLVAAGIRGDVDGPLFRPLRRDGTGFERRHLDRKTPWRLVKHYCRAADINPDRLGARGIGIHSLRKTAINDAIRNGAQMHEVREFAGHSDIRTTELYFLRRSDDAEVAARRIQIRPGEALTPIARFKGIRRVCYGAHPVPGFHQVAGSRLWSDCSQCPPPLSAHGQGRDGFKGIVHSIRGAE